MLAGYYIPSVIQEESYTSKALFLDMDPVPDYGKETDESVFSEWRVKCDLYRAKDGRTINADTNGALNIIRKEYPDAFAGTLNFSYLLGTVGSVSRGNSSAG